MSFDAAHWVIVLFAAVLGGAVGSFLNVVVYRLPNRLSLIWPPSHCPICKEPIRWFDNVPVFGWIMLGGHCRHCHCWIPLRYPLVEALTAAMFAALALVENPADGHLSLSPDAAMHAAMLGIDRVRWPSAAGAAVYPRDDRGFCDAGDLADRAAGFLHLAGSRWHGEQIRGCGTPWGRHPRGRDRWA